MSNQTVTEGQSVTFEAEASGVPLPTLGWQKDGRQIYAGGDHYQVRTEGNRSTLYIASVRPDDEAWYQCTAASVSGTATNRVRLQVIQGRLTLYIVASCARSYLCPIYTPRVAYFFALLWPPYGIGHAISSGKLGVLLYKF